MLKTALFDCEINEKCRSVDGVRGICPPHPGAFDTSIVPTPGEFAVQGKKNANARGGGVNYAKNPKPHSSCRTNSS